MKMKTALSIVKAVQRRLNEPEISSLTGITDQDDLQILHLLYQVTEDLRRKGPFRQQVQTHDFDTVSSTNSYPLPGDFYEAMPRTYYNQDTDWRLIGPLTDAEFMAYKEGELYIPTEYVFRIKGFDQNSLSTTGRQIELYPTPSSAENLTFEYISSNMFLPPNWAASTAYTTSDWVNVNGRIYKCSSNGTSGSTPPSGATTGISDGTAEWDWYSEDYDQVEDDGDFCIFDTDLVKLGLRAMYVEEQGGALAERAMAEYKRAIKAMRFRFDGQTRANGACRGNGDRRHSPYVSPGSWSWS